jgi:hypothetical protein
MSVRAITELLHAGVSNHDIARQVGVDHQTVADRRAALNLPDARTIKGPASPEDLYWRRTRPTSDGHLEWTGHRNNTGVARRVAFRIRWEREPIGRVTSGCEHDGCVHPDCVEDQPMREQYAAIFGEVAA